VAKYKVDNAQVKKTNQVSVRNRKTGEISSSVLTKNTQVGSPGQTTTQPTFKTYGNLKAYSGLSGSLQQLTDGTDYLIAGAGITVQKNTNGSMTITAGAISPASALTFGNGFDPYNTSYNGTAATPIAIGAESNKGLGVSSSGIKLDVTNLSTTVSPTTSYEIIVADGVNVYRSTLNNVLSLGVSSGITLNNPVTIGHGLVDTGNSPAETSYNNSTAVTLAIEPEANKGLSVNAVGLRIDPSTLTSVTVDAADKVLIGDVNDSDAIKYVTAQSIANLASVGTLPHSLAVGNGLSPFGSSFNGAAAIALSVSPSDATIAVDASGISVSKVPNSLNSGDGISALSFDGSSMATVSVEAPVNSGLNSKANGLYLELSNLPDATFNGNDYLPFYDYSGGTTAVAKSTINSFKSAFIDTAVEASRALGTPYNLTEGTGIASFTFNGASAQQVSIDTTLVPMKGELNGKSYLVAGSGMTIVSASDGQITLSSAGGGGGVGSDAPIVSWESDTSLTNERIVTSSAGFSIVNDGANLIMDTDPRKVSYRLPSGQSSGSPLTIPNARFDDNSYDNNKTDVYLNGVMLISGSLDDYSLVGDQNSVIFNFDLVESDTILIKFT
jgi:hypothetical protein